MCLTTTLHGLPQNTRVPKYISPAEVNHLVAPPTFPQNVDTSSSSLEDIVKEVDAMIKSNPNLPRLTRGEIIDLLDNITKTDEKLKMKHQTVGPSFPKGRKSKAVMKVLPFTPDINGNNVEDFYTKAPITKIVGSHLPAENVDESNSVVVKYDRPDVTFDLSNKYNKPTADKVKKYHGNQRSTKSTTTMSTSTTQGSKIESSSNEMITRKPGSFVEQRPHYSRRRSPATPSTTTPVSTYVSKGRRPTRRSTTISTTTRYPNHRYEDETPAESISISSTLFPSNGINVITPPSLPAKVINEDLLNINFDKKKVIADENIPVSFVPVKDIDLTGENDEQKNEALPLVIEIPEHLKGVIGDLNLETALKSIHYNKKPYSLSNEYNSPKVEDTDAKNVIPAFNFLGTQYTATTTAMPNIDNVVDTLTPEMKDLLMNFGLIPNTNDTVKPTPMSNNQVQYETYNPEKAEIKADSYIGFKPLPDDNNSRSEMQELLARFGLGRSARKQKSSEYKKKDGNMDMGVPNEYKKLLEEIEWGAKSDGSSETDPHIKTSKRHVFDPSENTFALKEEIEKLNSLSNVVKHLEGLNRTLTNEDLKQIDLDTLRLLVNSLNNSFVPLDEQEAPNPLDLDYHLIKNEVKRQENIDISKKIESDKNIENTETNSTEVTNSNKSANTDTTPEKSVETNSTSSVTSDSVPAFSVDDTVTPNIKDLADSFGGTSAPETSSTQSAPAPKRTGFYYLLDWNTFFDIDDQKGRRVNLRFQPKAGDPKRFYSVTVP